MEKKKESLNFIEHIIEEDLKNTHKPSDLGFRFPPEPNGYLHIGHTKAIGINFGLGLKYNAPVNLRFDDTNPAKEEQEYVDTIKEDIKWLGYTWDKECYSSDYFQQLYHWAILLVKQGKAYVDSQDSETMALQKGTPTQKGIASPYRNRSIEENLTLFEGMKNGEFDAGTHVLRAKIDMEHPNMLMRDPIMYRILYASHHRTGNDWCIYPMYDWTHGESDYIEQVSHSLCSLEFKPHRPLYDWFRDHVYEHEKQNLVNKPKQIEFARLNLNYTIMSKRKLLRLVQEGYVTGWDDPRMPTLSGLRRRGYTPTALKNFIKKAGVAKRENVIDVSLLEFCIREDLNKIAPRAMGILDPIKLTIENYPSAKVEWLSFEVNPEAEQKNIREIPFSKELYIERKDFQEYAEKNFYRLSIGTEVRLKNGYIIKATDCIKDKSGRVIEVIANYDTESLSGSNTEASKRKVKSTIHWVSVKHAIDAEIRVYDRLFLDPMPDAHPDKDFIEFLNHQSLHIKQAKIEPYLSEAKVGDTFQFQRLGYFNVDKESENQKLVFNKTVGLRDLWAKNKKSTQSQKQGNKPQNSQIKPINLVLKLGKKLAQVPEEKQQKMMTEIKELASKITMEELEPLFQTSNKKKGTRIAVAIILKQLVDLNHAISEKGIDFVTQAKEDDNSVLSLCAQSINLPS